MPLEERVIQPNCISRGIIDDQKPIYNQIPNELECFTNGTLANIIKQLSSLSMYAEDLFASILQDAGNLIQRTTSLQQKLDNLSIKVTQLDSTNEDISLHDIHLKKPYKPQNTTVQEIFSKKTMPKSIQELYHECSKAPPLYVLNQFRDDGKDSMKFYTNPNFFFELWRDAMLRQVEKEKNNKKPVQRPSNKMQNGLIADGKKPRQPANSNERYRKMVSQQEFLIGDDLPNRNVIYMSNNEAHSYDQYDTIQRQNQMDVYGTYNSNQINQQQQQMQPHYAYHNGNQNINNNESNAAYYGTIKNGVDYVDNNLIQNNINNNCAKHSNYLSNHNNNGMSHHHLQQINGNHQINNSITPPPSYQAMNQFNQFNSQQQQDQYNQQMQQQNQMQTLNRRTSRPSQPPPQPPQPLNGHPIEYHQTNGFINHYNSQQHTNLNSSNSSNNNNELVNTKLRPQSLSRDVLGLPPPVPNIHHQMNNTNDNHHHHNLPPPMPINLNGKLVSPANLQQSINNQTSNIAPLVNIPPPPPMPTNLLNNNGSSNNKQSDVTDNAKSNSNNSSINSSSNTTRPLTIPAIKQTTFEQEILQKQKQLQPVKNIKRPPPKSDPRNDLLASIREGIKLRRVEDSKQKEVEKNENLLDVASILARRVAMELSDSDTNDSNNSDNDDDWVDESNV